MGYSIGYRFLVYFVVGCISFILLAPLDGLDSADDSSLSLKTTFCFDHKRLEDETCRACDVDQLKKIACGQLRLAVYIAERTRFKEDGDFFGIDWSKETCTIPECKRSRLCQHERHLVSCAFFQQNFIDWAKNYLPKDDAGNYADVHKFDASIKFWLANQWVRKNFPNKKMTLDCSQPGCVLPRLCVHERGFGVEMLKQWRERGQPCFLRLLADNLGSSCSLSSVIKALERVYAFLAGLTVDKQSHDKLSEQGIAYAQAIARSNWGCFRNLLDLYSLKGKEEYASAGSKNKEELVALNYSTDRDYFYRHPLTESQKIKSVRIMSDLLNKTDGDLQKLVSACVIQRQLAKYSEDGGITLIDSVVMHEEKN